MNKFAFAILNELSTTIGDNIEYSLESKISDVLCDEFDEFEWLSCLINIELLYGFNIPDELGEELDLTFYQFSEKLAELKLIKDIYYPEYFEIKMSQLIDIPRIISIEEGLEEASENELNELKEKVDRLEKRRLEIIKEL
jgi:hypothetical protein